MKLKKFARLFLLHAVAVTTAIAISLAAAQAPERPGEGVTVRPGVASWTSALPVSWAFIELLTELGYEVREPTLFPSNPLAYLAIVQGDIDYWPNAWFPFHYLQLPDGWEGQATVLDPHCPACGLQGFLADIPSIERFGITSLDDFRREEVRTAFDTTGDGRADLFGCPPGWGCHEEINAVLDEFGLQGYINHITAEYAANFADVLARIQAGEPTLYYTWAPSAWIFALVPGQDVLWINTPGIRESEDEVVSGLAGAVTDPVQIGFVAADIAVFANNAFLEANPAAAALFGQVRLPLEWISEVDTRIVEEGLDDAEIRALAREWIEEHRELVDEWLETARQAAR